MPSIVRKLPPSEIGQKFRLFLGDESQRRREFVEHKRDGASMRDVKCVVAESPSRLTDEFLPGSPSNLLKAHGVTGSDCIGTSADGRAVTCIR